MKSIGPNEVLSMTPKGETTALDADQPIPSAFAQATSAGFSEDDFDALLKVLPQGTGDLDALLEQEMATAGRANSLELFRRLHSIRALSIMRRKGSTNENGAGVYSGDSGKTDVDANVPKLLVPTQATALAGLMNNTDNTDNTDFTHNTNNRDNSRLNRQKRRRKAVSRDPSYDDMLNTSEGTNDKTQKKERRMISNRESARRSRLRKQELMLDLENQVARLTEENEALKTRIKALEAQQS